MGFFSIIIRRRITSIVQCYGFILSNHLMYVFTVLHPDLGLLLITGVLCGSENSIEKHLEMGKKLLAAGQLADALSHFHAAVGELVAFWFYAPVYLFLHYNIMSVMFFVVVVVVFYHFLTAGCRWWLEKLHGLLQKSHRLPGHGKVEIGFTRFKQSHRT